MAGVELITVPTDSILVRPSFGATLFFYSPLKGLLSTGNSLGVTGFGIPLMFFFDALFDGTLDGRNAKTGYPFDDHNTNHDAYDDEGGADEDSQSWRWWRTSWDDQQSWALGWIEGQLEKLGLEGRTCGLRFICEMQHHPIHRFSILGEAMSDLFSFHNSSSSDVLQEYMRAEDAGKDLPDGEGCEQIYTCPVSVFKLFGGSLNQNGL